VAVGDVHNRTPTLAADGRARYAQLAAVFDEQGYGLENAIALVPEEAGVETDAERKTPSQ
jgi:hypothetical protein